MVTPIHAAPAHVVAAHVVPALAMPVPVDTGSTAWVLAATVLVALMVPGIALFYGGMVGARNVLSLLQQAVVTMAVVAVGWIVLGFGLAFGPGGPVVGGVAFAGLTGMDRALPALEGGPAVPTPVFAGFQLMFAVVTAVLVLGAAAERWRFTAVVPFMVVWPLLVYAPIAHWVFSPDGWAHRLGALDFAGGTVVHVTAGAAALAVALAVGRRHAWPDAVTRPHNLPFVMLGAGLLWVGWFGFNAGSALRADAVAGHAVLNTAAGAATGLLAWILVERVRYGKTTTLGSASGLVAGLVAVTPGAGYLPPVAALIVGAAAGAGCALAVELKTWLGYDDTLDVVGVHLTGGVIGSLLVGLFASTAVNPAGADGLFLGGRYDLLGAQALVTAAVAGYSFLVTFGLAALLDRLVGHRVSPAVELAGLDLVEHGESAYSGEPTGAGR